MREPVTSEVLHAFMRSIAAIASRESQYDGRSARCMPSTSKLADPALVKPNGKRRDRADHDDVELYCGAGRAVCR